MRDGVQDKKWQFWIHSVSLEVNIHKGLTEPFFHVNIM